MILILDPAGQSHPIGIDVFYGNNSNVVNISPLEDFTLGEYTLLLSPEITFRDGTVLGEEFRSTFSTELPPAVEPDADKRGCVHLASFHWVTVLLACLFAWFRKQDRVE